MRNYIRREAVLKSKPLALLLVYQQLSLCKKCGRKARFRGAVPGQEKRRQISTMGLRVSCGKVDELAKTIQKIADQGVEIRVLPAIRLDLSDRMDDRRVVLAAEAPSDFGQRRVRQRLA